MKLIYYTDGACEPNPGNGTWAFICSEPYTEQSGYDVATTSNRMEMMAAIKAIEHAVELQPKLIMIRSDSRYLCNGFNSWMHRWAENGWKTLDGPVKNVDLWQQLFRHKNLVKFEWIRGHNGNEFNELVDELTRIEFERTFNNQPLH